MIGVKNFGYSNGIHLRRLNSISNYSTYYTKMRKGTLEIENKMKKEWGNRYISLIDSVKNYSNGIRVFTNDGKFISQDTEHLTKSGSVFYSKILNNKLSSIFSNKRY